MNSPRPLAQVLQENLAERLRSSSQDGHAKLPIPRTDDELHQAVLDYIGIDIPRVAVCDGHVSPFSVFAEVFFNRSRVVVIHGSRGFSGKSLSLAALGHLGAIIKGASVSIAGGSGEQAERVHSYMIGDSRSNLPGTFWAHPNAPKYLLASDPTKRYTTLTNGGLIQVILASQKSARGAHPNWLLVDEVDEVDITLLDALLGQPMESRGIPVQIVLSSTWHHSDGTFTEVLRRAEENGWPIRRWCWRESCKPHGWLEPIEVDRRRKEITAAMWCLPLGQNVFTSLATPMEAGFITEDQGVLSGSGVARVVKKVWSRDSSLVEELVELKIQGLPKPIFLTPNHVVMTPDGKKPAGELKYGDRVISPRRTLVDGGSYEDGYVIGLHLAEGHIEKGRGFSIGFSIHEDEVEHVVGVLSKWYDKHKAKPSRGFMSPGPVAHRGNGKCMVVQFSSEAFVNMLCYWTEFGGTARTKRFTRMPYERDMAQGVLDGWLYGDGHESKPGSFDGVTYSHDLAWQMFQIAQDLGYATGMSQTTNLGLSTNQCWHVRISVPRSGWRRDQVTRDLAVEMFHSGIQTRQIAKELHVSRNSVMAWARKPAPTSYNNQVNIVDGASIRLVRSVKRIPYSGTLVDFEVSVDHTYVAGGIIVSNSAEYDLAEPNPGERAFAPEKVDAMFRKELGEYTGDEPWLVFEPYDESGMYVTGADWARKIDKTAILSWRVDVWPNRLVAYSCMGRVPWPEMTATFDQHVLTYPGYAGHDATGLGDVVAGFLSVPAYGFILQGKMRYNVLNGYIGAVERGQYAAPMIRRMYNEHKRASRGDLFGTGEHLPDTVCASAIASAISSSSGWVMGMAG